MQKLVPQSRSPARDGTGHRTVLEPSPILPLLYTVQCTVPGRGDGEGIMDPFIACPPVPSSLCLSTHIPPAHRGAQYFCTTVSMYYYVQRPRPLPRPPRPGPRGWGIPGKRFAPPSDKRLDSGRVSQKDERNLNGMGLEREKERVALRNCIYSRYSTVQ